MDADWDGAVTRNQEPGTLSGKSRNDAETLILDLIWRHLKPGGSSEASTSESVSHDPVRNRRCADIKKQTTMSLSISFFFFYVQTKLS